MSVAEQTLLPEASPALRRCLEVGLRRPGEASVEIQQIRRCPSDLTTSYPVAIFEVQLRSGHALRVFLKDFGASRLPKPGRPPERESLVYRELLDPGTLGTPAYLGRVWTDGPGPRWLLIEYVDAPTLKHFGFDDWMQAAAWLGRLHGTFSGQAERLEGCDFLEHHDATFFTARAERARQSLSHYPPAFGERLETLLRGHDRVVDRLGSLPETLVHGSFRPRNALLERGADADRIVAIDWELAARGSGLYDLAFFAEGFQPPRLDALIDAYRCEAARHGLEVADSRNTRELIDWFRLHKELKSLGDAHEMGFSEQTTEKILRLAEDSYPGVLPG